MSDRKISILFSNFGPYHNARVLAFKKISGTQVLPIQLSSRENLRKWEPEDNLEVLTVQQKPLEEVDFVELNKKLIKMLDDTQPDVIAIAGYALHPMRSAAVWAKRRNRYTILMSESQSVDTPRNWFKEKAKGWWIKRFFDSAFVGGERSAEYLIKLGFPPGKIWRGYDVVDNEYFCRQAKQIHMHEKEWRDRLKLPEKYFLYVGRFSPEKNLMRLFEAYRIYCNKTEKDNWGLVLVGGGPQESELRTRAQNLNLKAVTFIEFKQIYELPYYYALASCLILPSVREPWGLVVNEAMASGLPVLVSWKCGCVPELVHPGINGYIFDPESPEEIAFYMIRISSGEVNIVNMGEASRGIIQNLSPATWAMSLMDCIEVGMRGAILH